MMRLAARQVRSGRLLAVAAAALIGLAVIAAVVAAGSLRRDAGARAAHETSRLAMVLAGHAARMLQAIDVVLIGIDRDKGLSHLTGPAQLREAMGTQAVHMDLLARSSGLAQADSIMVIDAEGALVNATRNWPAPAVSVADRSYFAALRAPSAALTISEPMDSRLTGGRIVVLARRISAPDGRFLGVLAATLRLATFQEFYGGLGLAPGMAVTVLRSDGVVLTDWPPARSIRTGLMPVASAWYPAVTAGGGDYWSPGWLDGESRRVSVHPVAGFPVVVDVSITASAAYASWYWQAAAIAAGTACAALCLLLLLRALLGQVRGLEAMQAALLKKSLLLETTLAHMEQGLMMITADRTVGVVNERARELLGLPPELMREGVRLDDVLHYLRRHGTCAGPAADLWDPQQSGGVPGRTQRCERRRHDGTVLEIRSVTLPGGGLVQTHTDITERTLAGQRILHAARHDGLTALPNRLMFSERLAEAIGAGGGFAVLLLDLDRFKRVNDTLGHAAGDELLRQVAARMGRAVRDTDTLARMGGDEFALLVPGVHTAEATIALAGRLRDSVRDPFALAEGSATIGLSIGIACFPADGTGAADLLKHADLALYRAKAGGRNGCCVFDSGLDMDRHDELVLENALLVALRAEQFVLAYQPIWDIRAQRIVGAEALVRWQHPVDGMVPPSRFIPLAERTGLIVELGRWVMAEACREAVRWACPIAVSVNVAAAQLRRPDFIGEVRDLLAATGLPPGRLKLEVTETQLLDETTEMFARMTALREIGVRLALDDFGTGHSSLNTLRSFPFSDVKIDRGFTGGIVQDPRARGLVESILQVCRVLNLDCVAEGVETAEQLALLQGLGCTHAQGYLIGRPEPAASIRQALWAVAGGHRPEVRRIPDEAGAAVAG